MIAYKDENSMVYALLLEQRTNKAKLVAQLEVSQDTRDIQTTIDGYFEGSALKKAVT